MSDEEVITDTTKEGTKEINEDLKERLEGLEEEVEKEEKEETEGIEEDMILEEPVEELIDEWSSDQPISYEDDGWGFQGTNLEIGDKYMMLLKEKDSNKIFIGQVSGINPDDGIALLINDLDQEDILQFSIDGLTLLLKTDEYEILDIQKVKMFDSKILSEDDKELKKRLTREVFSDIELDIQELAKEDRVYSKQECKESLLSDIIGSYNAVNKMFSQERILDDINILVSLVYDKKHDKLGNTVPKWLIPIIDNDIKRYGDEEDTYIELQKLYEEGGIMGAEEKLGLRTYSDIMKKILHSSDFILESEEEIGILLKNHEDKYYRDCIQNDSCIGPQGPFSFDERKNNRVYNRISDYSDKGEPIYTRLRDPQHIHAVGLLSVPDKYLSFMYDVRPHTKTLNLYEKCIFGYLASYNNLLKKETYQRVPILNKVVNDSEPIEDKATDSFVSYQFDKHLDEKEFFSCIDDITPSLKEIYESLDETLKDKILNYDDVKKVCLKYDLRIDKLSKEDTSFINQKITANTKKYSGKARNIKYKKIMSQDKKITLESRINMAKNIIFSMLNMKKRNEYIQQFISLFCKEPEQKQEKDWFYNIYDNEKLLCKHYLYLAGKSSTDKFLQMKQHYGLPPKDGNIYCKNCGEYICNEEFSLHEGYSDDKPIVSKQASLLEEEEPYSKYDDKYEGTINLVKNIGLGLGCSLDDKDVVLIIDSYDRMNEDLLANKRYVMTNISDTDEHPRVKEILKKYKKDKDAKKKISDETKHFQKYLKNTNKIIGYTSLIMILIQTGIPSYKLFRNLEFNMYDFTGIKELLNYDSIPINNKTIDYCIYALKKCSNKYKESDSKVSWLFYDELLSEEKTFTVTTVRDQFINVLRYCLSSDFPLLQERVTEYHKYYLSIVNKYTNYEWALYKPLSKNTFIEGINSIMNVLANENQSKLLTQYNSILLQNVSLIREIGKEEISDLLDITPSDIMIQQSFKRLFRMCVSLYGKTSKPNFFIDSNILHFIINSDDKIKEIFKKNGWNDKTNSLGLVSFKNLRSKVIPQIISHYQKGSNELNPCFLNEDLCNTYIHININNYDLSLLNVLPKRFYFYKTPVVFPEGNYEEISEKLKDNLFRLYCKDPSGEYVKRIMRTDYLYSQVLDLAPEVEVEFGEEIGTYEKNIKETEENFYDVISYIHNRGILPLNQYIQPHKIVVDELIQNDLLRPVEKRFLTVFSNNDYNNENLHKLVTDYVEAVREQELNKDDKTHFESTWRTAFKEIFSDMNRQTTVNLDAVAEYANECFNTHKDYRKRFESIFTKSDTDVNLEREDRIRLESVGEGGKSGFRYKKMNETDIRKLLVLLTDDPRYTNKVMNKYVTHIRYLLSILKHDHTRNTHVPAEWRLQQNNKDYINNYLSEKNMYSHGDLLKNKPRYNGFAHYLEIDGQHEIFGALFEHCSDLWNDLDSIEGSKDSMMNDSILRVINKGVLIKVLLKIGEIGTLCRQNDMNIMALFRDDIDIDEVSSYYDQFFCDILIDAFECFYDTKWTESNTKEVLGQRLAKQYEREKQSLIGRLDTMSDEQRHASTELQKMGVTNWFKNSDKEHMEHIQSENYDNETMTERYESINEIFGQNKVELDAMNMGAMGDDLINMNPTGLMDVDEDGEDGEDGYNIDDFDGDDYEFDDNIVENSFSE